MKTYVVSGGASGIGAATAGRLRADGHTVITVDLRDADVVADLSTEAGRSEAVTGADALIPVPLHWRRLWARRFNQSAALAAAISGIVGVPVLHGVLKRVRTYEWDKEVVPGITAVGTPGHSFGHTSLVVQSGSSKVFVQGDVTHVPYLFARNPGWHLMFDQIPDMAEATRRKTYDMLASEKMMVQGFHYPFPAHAYIEKTSTGYRETMVPWNAAI